MDQMRSHIDGYVRGYLAKYPDINTMDSSIVPHVTTNFLSHIYLKGHRPNSTQKGLLVREVAVLFKKQLARRILLG